MNIQIKKILLHNFLSYKHTEISLENKGICGVKGINNFKRDNAISNGSGKSSWISAICWVLTGETIQGISKNLQNIYIDEDDCYCSLDFVVDNDVYKITRFHKPKSDLKIIKNNVDISGKGIRESEVILGEYLPDLNKNLLSSVILLGQGLPNKLSNLTPSGRKEQLETLTKSDFMIEDIKTRINERFEKINTLIKENTTKIAITEKEIELKLSEKDSLINKLNRLKETNYDKQIEESRFLLKDYDDKLIKDNNFLENLNDNLNDYTQYKNQINEQKSKKLLETLENSNTHTNKLSYDLYKLESDKEILSNEITRLKSIKDVCPTCGQKIPGVIKQDTSVQEQQLVEINDKIKSIKTELKYWETNFKDSQKSTNEYFDTQIKNVDEDIIKTKNDIKILNDEIIFYTKNKETTQNNLIKFETLKESLSSTIKEVETSLLSTNNIIEIKNKELNNLKNKQKQNDEHLETVRKLDTLVKRDFRGHLLQNIINYVDNKCKEYSIEVFNNNEISFELNGNNIDIMYLGKSFESLSGGEKQKVDIILQLVIRDLLSNYLNFSCNILCLDEIFDNLDSLGTNSILNLITNKLNDIDSIFIISHHSDELEIDYDSELNIVKDESGISEVL